MPNFKSADYQSNTKIANSGYKRYFKPNKEKASAILIEACLSNDILETQSFFSETEKLAILKSQIRTTLNMVPLDMDQILKMKPNTLSDNNFELFQPMELFQGNSMLDYYLTKYAEI